MLTSQEINALGQICNDTWGYPNGLNSKVPTSAVKMSIQDNKMTCTYTTIINLATDRHLRDQVKKFEEESISIVSSYFSEVKKEFKKVTGRALKSKETGTDDSIEIITTSPFAPNRTAYYRRFTTYDVD